MQKGKIGIWMYRNDGALYIHNELAQELVRYGYEVIDNFDMRKCYCLNNKIMTEDGRDLTSLNLLFHMNVDESNSHQNDILHTFEMAGVKVINPYVPYQNAFDKYISNFKLRQAGVNVPPSILIDSDASPMLIKNIFDEWGSILIKSRFSAGGKGIIKIDNCEQFLDLQPTIKFLFPNFFLQKFIPFGDHDYRVELIDGEVLFCYSRKKEHSFKTNLHAGAKQVIACKYEEKFGAMAKLAAKTLNIPLTTVDLIKSIYDNQYYVLEVNGNLGVFIEALLLSQGENVNKTLFGADKRKIDMIVSYICRQMDLLKN